MIVANLFPAAFSRTQMCYPNSYLAAINQFLCNLAMHVEKVFVFELPGCERAKNLWQYSHPPNLFFLSTVELSEFFRSQSVDIWHDFGYYNVNALAEMRASLGQEFCITVDMPAQNLLGTRSNKGECWGGCDAAIYSSRTFFELDKKARIHRAGAFPDKHLDLHACTIPLGLDIAMVNPSPKADTRCLLEFPEDETIVLCYIELTSSSQADLLPLMNAFCAVAHKRRKLRLIISGPDPQQLAGQLKSFVLEKMGNAQIVFLPNPVPHAIPLLFSAADIFVQPSDGVTNDSLITTIYAMAHRLAVIVPRYSLASTLIENHKSGVLISSYTNSTALEHIQWTLHYAPIQLGQSLVKHARGINSEEMLRNFLALVDDPSLRHTIKAYLNLWTTLLEKRQVSFAKPRDFDCKPMWTEFLCSMAPALGANLELRTTKLGNEVAQKKLKVATHYELKALLHAPTIIKILEVAQSGASIEAITKSILNIAGSADGSLLRAGIPYHIGWCLNEGLLTSLPVDLQM